MPSGANYDMFTEAPRLKLDSQTRFGDPFRNLQVITHIPIHAFSHVLLGIDSGMNLQGRTISPITIDIRLAGWMWAGLRANEM